MSSCSANEENTSKEGLFASPVVIEAFKTAVADNGLVSMRTGAVERSGDVMATSVLHLADTVDVPQPAISEIVRACQDYGANVPAHQFSQEIAAIVPAETFLTAAVETECVTTDPPRFGDGAVKDPLQFLLAAASWTTLPGVDLLSLRLADVHSALEALGDDAASPWARWNCEVIAEAVKKPDLCGSLPNLQAVTQLTGTEDLMNLRAAAELNAKGSFPEPTAELIDEALQLPVADALDAAQILRIAELDGRESEPPNAWIAEEVTAVDANGLVMTEVKRLGTINETYAAARVLEKSTKEIIGEATRRSLDEVVVLAEKSSEAEGRSARLMRAVILDAAGALSSEEKAEALDDYRRLRETPCPAESLSSCLLAADAAFRLDDDAQPLAIEVPGDLAAGEAENRLIYRVLAFGWAVSTTSDWVREARARKLDPLADAAEESLPSSLRLWAAAARGALNAELDTGAENAVRDGVAGLTTCASVLRLAVSDAPGDTCDADSTFAYYLSGLWGTR